MGIEQIIIVIVVLVISFLNWAFGEGGLRDLLKKPDDRQGPTPRRQPPAQSSRPFLPQEPLPADEREQDAERERMRRFFEALGVPASELPPPIERPVHTPVPVPSPVARGQAPDGEHSQTRSREKAAAPRSVLAGGQSIREAGSQAVSTAQAYVRRDPSATLNKAERAALERLKGQRLAFPETLLIGRGSAGAYQSRWTELLRGPEAMRQAVVLREILGPPKALQRD